MAGYEQPCAGRRTIKIGRWADDHTRLFLHDVQEDGTIIVNYKKASPILLSALLLALEIKTSDAQEVIDGLPPSDDKRALQADIDSWKDRLSRYQEINADAMATTPTDPKSVWYCVTAPLILGWYPNPECSGYDPKQKTKARADVSTPIQIINTAICAGAFYDTNGIAKYFDFAWDQAKDLAEAGYEGAESLYEESKAIAEAARDHVLGYLDFQKKALPWIAGTVIVGGLVYLSYMHGPKTRRQ